jgi:hypothetical protein
MVATAVDVALREEAVERATLVAKGGKVVRGVKGKASRSPRMSLILVHVTNF